MIVGRCRSEVVLVDVMEEWNNRSGRQGTRVHNEEDVKVVWGEAEGSRLDS